MAAVACLALLSPYLYHTAEARIFRHEEVITVVERKAESLIGYPHDVAVRCVAVYLPQSPLLLRAVGILAYQLTVGYIMDLAQAAHVPSPEIPHVRINEEIVGLHIVGPAVQRVVAPSVPFPVYDKAGDKEFLHAPCVHLPHPVACHVVLKHRAHRLAEFLLVPVSGRAGRLLVLTLIHA